MPYLRHRRLGRKCWNEGIGAIEKQNDLQRISDDENPVVLQHGNDSARVQRLRIIASRRRASTLTTHNYLRKAHVADTEKHKKRNESETQSSTSSFMVALRDGRLRTVVGAKTAQCTWSICSSIVVKRQAFMVAIIGSSSNA